MPYKVLLKECEEGWAAWVPSLPGCASQGATEEEALANVSEAIREYLEAARELYASEPGTKERIVEVKGEVA